MPRRWKALIFLAVLLVTTLSFTSFASAHTDDVKVLHLTGVQVESQLVDVAPKGDGPSLGDSFVLSENLFRDGHKVGISGVVCTFVRIQHPPSAVNCVISARIGSDELTIQGFGFDQPSNVYAITGGTGRWRNAGGQVVVRDVSETESDITVFVSDLG
jgi:allene oxide cyclase-like protein